MKKRYWIIFSLLFAILFSSFCYTLDTDSIIRYEKSFAETILKGDFLNFYQHTYDVMQKIRPDHSPSYSAIMNFVLGLWGIPLVFFTRIANITDVSNSFFCILYGKSLLALALVITIVLVYKICKELEISVISCKYASFFYFTSLLVYSCIGIIGQTDILGLVFSLLGLSAYIQQKNKLFLVYFMLALPFKFFSFFLFFPLLLLREKKIINILWKSGFIFILTVIPDLVILNCPDANHFKSEFSLNMLFSLFSQKLPFINNTVSLFVVAWGGLCIYCYLKKVSSDKNINDETTVFVSLCSMISVFISFDSNSYWYFNLVPFIVFAIFYKKHLTPILIQIETVGMAGLTAASMIKNFWAFDVQNCYKMLLSKIFNPNDFSFYTLCDIFDSGFNDIKTVFNAIFILSMFFILYLYISKNNNSMIIDKTEKQTINLKPQALIMRGGINYGIAAIPMLLYIFGCIIGRM